MTSIFDAARKKIRERLQDHEPETIELFYGLSYPTSKKLAAGYRKWLKRINNDKQYAGAIGGRLTFEITPTSLGLVVVVSDAISGTKFNLTDYEGW